MSTNPLKSAAKPGIVIDAAKAREWAAFAERMGHREKAAMWAKEANRLAALESGFVDGKTRAAGA
jgi:hypothetical protein